MSADLGALVGAAQALPAALDGGDELREVELERVEDLVGVVLGAEPDLALAGVCTLDDFVGRAFGLADEGSSCWETSSAWCSRACSAIRSASRFASLSSSWRS